MPGGIVIYIDDREIPAFHPVHHREVGSWYPSNEAASLLIQLGHIWEDIFKLSLIRNDRQDEYEKRLLLKHMITELCSMFGPLERLQTIIMTAPERTAGTPPPWRSLSPEEKRRAKSLFKVYHRAKRDHEREVRDIRNRIGAHRSVQPWHAWQDIIELWDKLQGIRFIDLFSSIPAIYNFIKDLDLYDWVRETERGSIHILGARIYPGDFSSPNSVSKWSTP
mgnify:CR=1 FL=1